MGAFLGDTRYYIYMVDGNAGEYVLGISIKNIKYFYTRQIIDFLNSLWSRVKLVLPCVLIISSKF